MKLRAPAYPLITVDPYFSVWSPADRLFDADTVHWTSEQMPIRGILTVDGTEYAFLGKGKAPFAEQISVDVTALSTVYIFRAGQARVKVTFLSSLIPDDFERLSRPAVLVSFESSSIDGLAHSVSAKLFISEEICLDRAGSDEVVVAFPEVGESDTVSIGSGKQPILEKCGDDLRIDWGYLYLSSFGGLVGAGEDEESGRQYVFTDTPINGKAIVVLAYDDVKSIEYFGEKLEAFWKNDGKSIADVILEAYADHDYLIKKDEELTARIVSEGSTVGGEKYADILLLSYRQSIGAHKLVLSGDGEPLFISKECFSNGCAATVDVSYPSIPEYLVFEPKLVFGMLRPIFHFARTDAWKFDFAPHDAGTYPKLNGQSYGNNGSEIELRYQMPIEESGNMIIMTAAASVASGDFSLARENLDLLRLWARYLVEYGDDPGNQLCTDDFAGHLSHNCNLSVKAAVGAACFSLILETLGDADGAKEYMDAAKKIADSFARRASNGDGSLRLAYDRAGGFSMKYNAVWDRLFGFGLFDEKLISDEVESYKRRFGKYGLPLDDRSGYTKSDWLVYVAAMTGKKSDFEEFIAPLWDSLNDMTSRLPMTDWYETSSGEPHFYASRSRRYGKCFCNRTVVGGVFIGMLAYEGKLKRKGF